MRIASAEVQMNSTRSAHQHHEISESLLAWVGERPPAAGDVAGGRPGGPPQSLLDEAVKISEAGRSAQAGEAEAIEQARDAAENDPRIALLRRMIEMLTGEQVRIFDAAEIGQEDAAGAQATPAADEAPLGFGVEYEYREVYSESEQTAFSATGLVRTADGKEIAFSLALSMSRSYYEESSVSLRLGDAARQQKDPLVLDFAGNVGQLSDQRFKFDIDADGQADSINLLAPGAGFLAFDRNSDGRINDGRELFGTQSGDGFADLAAHDDDSNGWIDEADAIYSQLRLWTPGADGGGALQTLREANVGAIGLARVETPFSIRGNGNEALGQVRSSGIFLRENGGAGTIQQIDLSV